MTKKVKIDTIIVDFDSTILRGELLEMIAEIVFRHDEKKEEKVRQIAQITALGMEGKISFEESLSKRLSLIKMTKKHLDECVDLTKQLINQDYLDMHDFLNSKNLFVVSGGYKNVIDEVADLIKVKKHNIFANDLIFAGDDFIGIEKDNPLAKSNGKAVVSRGLKKGKTLMIGDGMTDYLVKKDGAADYFSAYVGIVSRDAVAKQADFVLNTFADLTNFIY